MSSAKPVQRAAIYLRISSDPEGRRLGVERQEADCRALCAEYGYEVVGVFIDNDVSASTRSTRERPEYERMLSSVQAGNAELVVSYSTSRLTRKPIEWERLFDLHSRAGVDIHLWKSGLLDLDRAFARRNLRNDATSDAYYAEELSELVEEASRHRAEKGEWHGGQVPFGFVRVGEKGTQGALEHHPERAALVRDLARRVLNGQSLYAVCMSLNRQGILTAPSAQAPEGARWHARTLKRVLTSPNTVGIRVYKGKEYEGKWEGILDRATWDRLCALLNEEDRATRQSWLPAHKYALSGLMVCGDDGRETKMISSAGGGRMSFMCSPVTGGCGKIRINMLNVEEHVVRQVLAVLDVPAVRQALTTRDAVAGDDELRAAIREDERRLQGLEDKLVDELLDELAYKRQRGRIMDRLNENRRVLASMQRETFLVDVGERTLREAWDAHEDDPGWRRTLLQHVVDRVLVFPHPKGLTTTPTRKRSESEESFAERKRLHVATAMSRRVRIVWKSERLPLASPDITADDPAFAHLTDIERRALWVSRMAANRPVQFTDEAMLGDAAGLLRSGGSE